ALTSITESPNKACKITDRVYYFCGFCPFLLYFPCFLQGVGDKTLRRKMTGLNHGYERRSHPRGSACLSVRTGSNRSPLSATRWSTCGAVKTRESVSFRLSAILTSCQVMGVETVGCDRARSE